MIALKVTHNKRDLCTAGHEDLKVLSAILSGTENEMRNKERLMFRVGGIIEGTATQHVNWTNLINLSVGDNIEIEVIETNEVDSPITTKPSPKLTKEDWERAKETYIAGKAEFE